MFRRIFSAAIVAAMTTMMTTAAFAAVASTPVMHFPMEINEDGEITESVTGKTYSLKGRHGEAVPAVVGNGVRLDGYSSFVQVNMSSYSLSDKNLTVSLWTACQTYPMMNIDKAENKEAAIVSCLDDTKKTGFAFILYSQGKYGFSCYINGEKKTVSPAAIFPQYEWVNLVATVDAVGGTITLYQNGKQVATTYAKGTINLPTGNLYIGKSFTDVKSGQFLLNTYNGIVDELKVYNELLSADEIANLQTAPSVNLNMPMSHYASDLIRPRHHAIPASNWMNESHGMTYYGGRYHIFFQKNGNGPYMARLHWGHLSSEDLCNWTEERIAIVPSKTYDLKGCWSGCVFEDEEITGGKPWILYTGVDNAKATINLATPDDEELNTWTKSSLNPVISGTPSGYSADFRDPYFFRSGGKAYAIVGTSKNGVASTSLHKYNETTKRFDYTGNAFFTGSNTNQCGTFFEMPNMTSMGGGKWLFTATPLGTSVGVRTIYYVGTVGSDGTFSTTQSAPKTVELPALARDGYGLLSPTIYQKDGKTIAMGIVPDKLAGSVNYQLGYAHTLSFPREWSIDAQGELIQKPYEGLQALRSENMVNIDAQTLNGSLSLDPVEGREIEVMATFTVASANFGINLLENDEGSAVKVYFNPSTNQFVVDCSSIGRRNNDEGIFNGVYRSSLPQTIGKGETMKIHLFFDHSILDVFINDRWATSIRIFATSSLAKKVSLFSEGDTPLQTATAWTMIPAEEEAMPTFLPTISTTQTVRQGCYDLLGRPIDTPLHGQPYIQDGHVMLIP